MMHCTVQVLFVQPPLATAAVENYMIKLVIDSLHTRETYILDISTVQACVPEGLRVVRVVITFGFTSPVPVIPSWGSTIHSTHWCIHCTRIYCNGLNLATALPARNLKVWRLLLNFLSRPDLLCLISLDVNTVDLLPLALISQSQLSSCHSIDHGLGPLCLIHAWLLFHS